MEDTIARECRRCEYVSADKSRCDYERHTGCQLPCVEGRQCHFRPDKLRDYNHLDPEQHHEILMQLYLDGSRDYEMAKAIGVSRNSVCKWRRKNGLPPNTVGKLYEEDFDRMYADGASDRMIADALGATRETIKYLRLRKGLPAHRGTA